jgi:GntR family transcriptional regulator
MNNLDSIIRTKPLAEQVLELLRERILQGQYPREERMPSEESLAQQLQVSRATLRTALAALAAEGLVQRRHGDGTYPTPNAFEITVRVRDAWNIERQIQNRGRTPSQRVLEQGLRAALPEERDDLGLSADDEVFAIRRVFNADDEPVMLAVHVVRAQGLAAVFPSEAASLPLLEFLGLYHKSAAQGGEAVFKAVLADENLARELQVAPSSPLLQLEAVLKDGSGHPFVLAWEYYRGQEGFILPVAPLPYSGKGG